MASITLQGDTIETSGELPTVGSQAPAFNLPNTSLDNMALGDFESKTLILNIYPSIDTGVCAQSTRQFNQLAAEKAITVINISADLPFAHGRFCAAEGLDNVTNLSVFRNPEFGRDYGVTITTGPLQGLLARAIVVIRDGEVIYTEQVPEIAQEPDYEAAIEAATKA